MLGDGKSGTAWFIGNVPQTGRQVSVADLNKGVIIQSGNDALLRWPITLPGARSHLLV